MFGFKRKLTQRQLYGFLFNACQEFKLANTKKPIQDRINRSCNKYAVRNTVMAWRKQYEI